MVPGSAWREFAKKSNKQSQENKHKDNYILVYQIHSATELNAYAKEMSKKLGLPLLRVSPTLHQITRGGKFVYLPDITEFLCLIDNASFMMTDSFHGTAFAINFNTPFAEVLPDNGTSSRNVSILNLTGLNDRIITKHEQLDSLATSVDFTNVNEIIARKRNDSREILKEMLNSDDQRVG